MSYSKIITFCLLCFFICSCNKSESNKKTIRSTKVITVIGEYKGWACGELTPQIIPIEKLGDVNIEKLQYGFEFWVPKDVTAPDQVDVLHVPGNKFKIKGNYYYTIENGNKHLAPRFDLIEWQPLPHAKRWEQDSGEAVLLSVKEYASYTLRRNQLRKSEIKR